jgi:hypothetical protein
VGAVAVPHGEIARFASDFTGPRPIPQPTATTAIAIAIAEPTTATLRLSKIMTMLRVDL